MKAKTIFLNLICATIFFIGCKEKTLDSPYITILTPVANQVFQDKDSIRITAEIQPNNTSVTYSSIAIKDDKGHMLAFSNRGCACAGQSVVKLDHSILYAVKKKQEVTLEVCANLENGQTICETIPFVITK
jgi:hypothetical protein